MPRRQSPSLSLSPSPPPLSRWLRRLTADAAADAAPAEPVEEGPETDAGGIVRADRYALTGTTVLGKIDLSGLEGSGRRKRKTAGGASEAPASGARCACP